jgi:non-ribosomal peptide synthetase component F
MARCSFDIHVQEIFGTLMIGASLVMLHPRGIVDFEYLHKILNNKQISYIHAVPNLLHSLFTFIKQCDNGYALKYLRSLCSSGELLFNKVHLFERLLFTFVGEAFNVKLLDLIRSIGVKDCYIWNLYGPAETTIVSTFHHVNVTIDREDIPVGVPLSNYRCVILDEFSQFVVVDQEAELVVGGAGVFAGYLGRDDLTNKTIIEIDGELFYQTGDLVRMDNNGLLHYRGRKDHQIKLHGQRIELEEIERCLFNTSISACVVIKWGDDHLIAYVQSSTIDEDKLREHCQLHLPPHMIPSKFIVLDKLPLNANGKVDRKLLPPPDFSQLSSKHLRNGDQLLVPRNEIEVIIHDIWCDIFRENQISIDTNLFIIGGHSLLLIKLFYRYKIDFQLLPNTLSTAALFQHPTIASHAQLIDQIISIEQPIIDHSWSPLYLIQGKNNFRLLLSIVFYCYAIARASFAQERIILDEQIRFSSKYNNNIYVIPLLYRLSSSNDRLSINRLHHAFQLVITKHKVLRTALSLDTNGIPMQRCLDMSTFIDEMKFGNFSIFNLRYDNDHNIDAIINELVNHSDLFDLPKGRVICCHIFRQYRPRDDFLFENDDQLTKDDFILFCIHHSVFDGVSISIFLHDLSIAYNNHYSLAIDGDTLQYTDYSVYERLMDMTSSREFWYSQLEGYNFQRSLSFSVDRHRSSTNQRSGKASIEQISFDKEISTSFLNYASSHQLTLFQLGLAIFYTFLFKLTHGQTDLCISCLNANRYKSELENMIGMFVSTSLYRLQFDCHWSFNQLVKHVREKCLSILEHAHYPLQYILADFHLNQSNIPFLEIVFDFNIVSSNVNHLSLIGVSLEEMSMEQLYNVAKFDFMLTFIYNPTSDDNPLSCRFICSRDVFDRATVETMARRLKHLVSELFSSNSIANPFDTCLIPIIKLDLILPEEIDEMKSVIFCRQSNVINEGMSICLWTEIFDI